MSTQTSNTVWRTSRVARACKQLNNHWNRTAMLWTMGANSFSDIFKVFSGLAQ